MMSNLKQDYRRYRETGLTNADLLFSRGFQAVISYRLRHWLLMKKIPILHVIIGYITEVITDVEIPAAVCAGGGLVVYHGGPIHITGSARIGENVGIRPGVVIGGDFYGKFAPVLGNNIEVGVGAKILGNVVLGDYCQIGANAVVTKSFPSHSVLVGIPARPIVKG
ncbi:MAG: hypothetical protein WCK54_09625 [Desulfuromonadales bacterium]